MCGIAGFVVTTPQPGLRPVLERMTSLIAHRGPDDSGFYTDDYAYLGHRRLSIIDLALGHQPMTTEDGSRWIVYNGEIFNHAAVRQDLEALGHRYTTRSDTETIVHAYEQYGSASVERFRGMFAYALWNRETRTLFCARDRLGIKPLYYFWDGRLFAFASEIKALLEHPSISAEFDEAGLAEYLAFGYRSGEQTMFRGIRKLMPGHHLTLDLSGPDPRLGMEQYWDVPQPPAAPEQRSEADWIAECRQRLEETVRMRLMSDVPLGMFLSGGIDSSAIAALIKRNATGPVKTFAVGYSDERFSELSYAAHVARSIGTEHHEVVLGMDEFFGVLPSLVWHEDEPIAWPSSVSLYIVSRLAAKHVKVVLTGEGSDELFGGYERYRWQLLHQRGMGLYRAMPAGFRGGLRHWIASSRLLSATMRRKLGHTMLGRGDSLESLYLDNFYTAFPASDASAYASYRNYFDSYDGSSLSRMLYADQKTYLVELCMKQDQMSMACSIESRVPFLDHPFVEFATRVPDSLKIRGGTQKYILKRAVEDLLPREIIYRKKMGFPTPLRAWLLQPEAAPLLERLRARDGFLAGVFDLAEVERLLECHRSQTEDVTDRLWRLLNLQIWGDLFFTGKLSRQGFHKEGALALPRRD